MTPCSLLYLSSNAPAQVASFTGVKRRLDVAHTARQAGAAPSACLAAPTWGILTRFGSWTYLHAAACMLYQPQLPTRYSPCSLCGLRHPAEPVALPLLFCSESRDSRGSVGNAADSGEVGSKGSKGVRKGPTGPRGELSLSGSQGRPGLHAGVLECAS